MIGENNSQAFVLSEEDVEAEAQKVLDELNSFTDNEEQPTSSVDWREEFDDRSK